MPRVAVLHHCRSVFPLELFHQVGGAAELVWVLNGPSAGDAELERLLRRLGQRVDITGLDVDEAARRLGAFDLDGIVSFVDDHLMLAARLAARLGLTYHTPEVAEGLVDKSVQRSRLARAGVPGPRFWSAPAHVDPDAAAALAAEVSYPLVAKPAEGSGSRGIDLVVDDRQLAALLAADPAVGHVLEEYLPDGEPGRFFASYLSVESVVSRGRPRHVAFTGRFPLASPFRETGNFLPAIVDPALEAPLLQMVDGAVEALGITDAIIHTEIKLTPDGPRLIEVNGRLGGRPPYVLRRVCEVNLFQVACRLAAGEDVAVEAPARADGVGFWLMLQPPVTAEWLVAVSGLDALAAMPQIDSVSLLRQPGDRVDWREGTDSRVVTVRGRVDDHAELESVIGVIHRTVELRYDPPLPSFVEPVSFGDGTAGACLDLDPLAPAEAPAVAPAASLLA